APARTEPLGPPAAKAETLPDVMDETLPDVMDETLPDVMDETLPDVMDETLPDVMDEDVPDVMDDEALPDVMDEEALPDVMDEMPHVAEQPAGIDALRTEEEPANVAVPEAAEQVTPSAPAEQSAPPPVITSMPSATRHGEGESGQGQAGPFGARLG